MTIDTIKEVAGMMKESERTVAGATKETKVRAYLFGGWRTRKDHLQELLNIRLTKIKGI